MQGSDAILGWNDGEGNALIGDFFLRQQMPSQVNPANKQELYFSNVLRKNGQLALLFERPLYPTDSVAIEPGLLNILVAAGNQPETRDLLTYHQYRYIYVFKKTPPPSILVSGISYY